MELVIVPKLLLLLTFVMYATCTYTKRRYRKKGDVCEWNGNWTYIPKIPEGCKTLIIRNGKLKNITGTTFSHVTGNITRLELINCHIENISQDAFTNLTSIKGLDLSRNYKLKPSIVRNSLNSLAGSGIISLSLNWMSWSELPSDMFHGLNTTIKELQLNHNFLRNFSGEILLKLKHLRSLDLSWNGLTDGSVNFTNFHNITELDLSGNWFLYFPNFCDPSNETSTPALRNLSLSKTKIMTLSREIRCLDNIQHLSLSAITVRRLYNNTFANLKSLKALTLTRLGSQLLIIEPTAFNSSSLEVLKFSMGKGYRFTNDNIKHFTPKKIFSNCKNLQALDLSNNIFNLSGNYLISMFNPIRNLTSLTIKRAGLKHIPDLSKALPYLKVLILAMNKIKTVPSGSFDDFKHLEHLDLRGNKISFLTEKTFPDRWLHSSGFNSLLLDGNPFSCTCDILDFQNWMERAVSFNISLDRNNLTCSKTQERLIDYHPDKSFECLLEYAIPFMILVPFVIIIGLVVYIFRWRIKLFIFKTRSRKKKYERLLSSDYFYDAYVTYSDGDISWVQNTLIQKIEDQYKVRLCIRDRDFELGTVFSNHIVESIERSRTVILLFSESFAKDKWCEFQMNVASHMNITKDSPTIIVILLEDIGFSVMTEPIYNFMHNQKYIRWPKNENDEDLFWNELLRHVPCSKYLVYNEYSSLLYSGH